MGCIKNIFLSNATKRKLLLNLVVLGNTCVGKTSLLEKLTTGIFNPYHDLTLGIKVYTFIHNDKTINFHDTAGMEKYHA